MQHRRFASGPWWLYASVAFLDGVAAVKTGLALRLPHSIFLLVSHILLGILTLLFAAIAIRNFLRERRERNESDNGN